MPCAHPAPGRRSPPAPAVSEKKTKKGEGPETVTLLRTPDVLLTASQLVHTQGKRPVLVGFAAETHDVVTYAKEKLARKRLDLIVANDVSAAGAGFGVETNVVTILGADGSATTAQGTKREVAGRLWDLVAARMK
jgi:phosphopantothenoylcysteine decarboxylase/phosphopantothenate--cysteine ligase